MMTREEHLAWAKTRALEYADRGDTAQAVASFGSDLSKHPQLENHPAIGLMGMMLFSGNLSNPAECRKFIEGFN